MSRSVAGLAPDRMTRDALFRACLRITALLRFPEQQTLKDVDKLLDQLDQMLIELELRGDQLALPIAPQELAN